MRQARMYSGQPQELEPGDLDGLDVEREMLLASGRPSAFDIRALAGAAYRNRAAIGIILLVALLLGLASILFMPRIYEAEATVQIDQQTAKVLGTEDVEPAVSGTEADRFLQTQVDVLTSRGMAKRVIDSLGLDKNGRFFESLGDGSVADLTPVERDELLLSTLQKNLTINLPRNSRIVGIAFSSRNPELSAQIANTYAKQFIQANIQRKFSTGDYSRNFLQNQLDVAKKRLEVSERQLIDYSRAARLIDASQGATTVGGQEGPRSLVTANLVQLNQAYADAKAARLQAEQRWQQARGVPVTTLPEVLSNPGMQQLLQKRAELNADLSQMRQHMRGDHPTVLQAMAQVNELDQRTNALAENIRSSIRNQYVTAAKQETAIEDQVNTLKSATLSEQDRGVTYNILKREVDTNRQMYEGLLSRFKELSAQAGITNNNITVVDEADVPIKPSSPRKKVNMAIALAAGLIIAFAYAYGRDKLDDAIRDPRDVEAKLHLPLLGVIPAVPNADIRHELDTRSLLVEAYHTIRSSVELSSNQGLPKSLVITSSNKGEGKSTTSFALARDFARLGRKVLIVDADLRRPSLASFFGAIENAPGLSSVLARMVDAKDAVVSGNEDNLWYLPSGPLPPDPASLFAGSAIHDLLAALSDQYEVIVFDAPPVMALADSVEMAAAAQATIFVVEAGSAHFGQTKNAVTRLLRAQAKVIGCVVTKYDRRLAGYGADYDSYSADYR
ncbi:exopolysaccharide biosynthesis protein [Novosphingobium sp. Rr 2-17]|uniref:GumC family protein n=1 Tax=Novosphingobium sp. Rr 2-17 TaxID=555793 RepID=UPI0002698210|nr:polysaccharide biosynthesis tyrosine autokinase [Novosphingobium sp. Rr 2-17]EIZ79040.1 exopolysaccharide biosynthesis protein [Novosphingobium sp. Rr 2-17]